MNYGRGMGPLECGGISVYENGNGSLMRILPLAYYFVKQPDDTIGFRMETVHNVSALTHRHPVSLIGCGIYINIAMKLLTCGSSLYTCIEQGISEAFGYYEARMYDDLHSYIRLKRLSDFAELSEEDIKSSGYIVDTLEAAVWCLLNSDSYRKCVQKAVNLGDDTDTVGAVAGGLAGIYYGYEEIPCEWLNVLAKRKYIEEVCERLQDM